jgi:membrane protein
MKDLIIHRLGRYWKALIHIEPIAHLLRAVNRFNDRLGQQFGAAVTYFSFLSLIPVLMVLFAAAGFILASNADLLTGLIDKIVSGVSDPSLANTLKTMVHTAVEQRTTVGLSGLVIALYSGINWIASLRAAIRAQMRDVWEMRPEDKDHVILQLLKDLGSLIGMMLALILSVVVTSIGGSLQTHIIAFLGLTHITWLAPVWSATAFVISITANYLMFLFIFVVLPQRKNARRPLLVGTLIAAIGFEIIKYAMGVLLPRLSESPSGAAFGSIIGLMAFFYFFARLTLFCAAWIATAKEHIPDVVIEAK